MSRRAMACTEGRSYADPAVRRPWMRRDEPLHAVARRDEHCRMQAVDASAASPTTPSVTAHCQLQYTSPRYAGRLLSGRIRDRAPSVIRVKSAAHRHRPFR